jgi:uncharacterized LabA/DUF88 family protein
MEKTFVFIDGQYLSLISKHFGEGIPIKIDLNQFAITISKDKDLWCDSVYYYTAPPYQHPTPTQDEVKRRANYDKWVTKLKRIPNFNVREGRCQRIDNDYNQKGVDSLILMDLYELPKDIKTIILVACDTDFVPILNKMKERLGLRIILYGFHDRIRNSKFSMSNHIVSVCNEFCQINMTHFDRSLLKES